MPEYAVILRPSSDSEARLVQELLQTYGIPVKVSHDAPQPAYPLNVGEIRVSVPEECREEAMSILEAHRASTGDETGE